MANKATSQVTKSTTKSAKTSTVPTEVTVAIDETGQQSTEKVLVVNPVGFSY